MDTPQSPVETKYRVVVSPDDDTYESPAEGRDDLEIFSFNLRHNNFKHPDTFGLTGRAPAVTSTQPGLRRKLETGTAFILSCYQHSGIVWSLKGEGMQDRFDTAQVAGLLLQKGRRGETYAQREQRARGFLEAYNAWCNGEIYVAELQSYLEGEEADAKDLETCGGLHGRSGVDAWLKETCEARGINVTLCPLVWR